MIQKYYQLNYPSDFSEWTQLLVLNYADKLYLWLVKKTHKKTDCYETKNNPISASCGYLSSCYPVYQCRCQDGVTKDLFPPVKAEVRGNDGRFPARP